ncbi:MAG: ion channel [Candidatus Peregrinibacteria bacterium]
MWNKEFKFHIFFLVVTILVVLAAGAVTFAYLEGWSFIDSLHFVVMLATTIGYGDLVPTSELSKILTMIFTISIIPFVLYLFSLFAKVETAQLYKKLHAVERMQKEQEENIAKAQKKLEEQRRQMKEQEEENERQKKKLKEHAKELNVQEKELEVVEDIMGNAVDLQR